MALTVKTWIDGYIADIDYLRQYLPELNPLWPRLVMLKAGLTPPDVTTACELGFGQGVSVAMHAAASPTQWYGTDANSSHVSFADGLAAASRTDVRLYNESFAEFANRTDLPAFDFIAAHGVWSWISDRNRKVIVDFVQQRLKPGGLFYLSYDALPGCTPFIALRQLLFEHAQGSSVDRELFERMDMAVAFADRLLATQPDHTRGNSAAIESYQAFKQRDRRATAHEFFNRHWDPMHFATVGRLLVPVGLSWACSAAPLDSIDALKLSPRQQALVEEQEDPIFRQTVRDFILNTGFRREYWVKGATRLSGSDRTFALRRERVVLAGRHSTLTLKMRAVLELTKVGPREAVCRRMLETLSDHEAWTLGEIEKTIDAGHVDLEEIIQAALVLAGCGLIVAAQDDETSAEVRPRTDRLNDHLLDRARTGDSIDTLASPVVGGGVKLKRLKQLFLLSRRNGAKDPEAWAKEAWDILSREAQPAPPEETLADLIRQAHAFADQDLPALKALQVA